MFLHVITALLHALSALCTTLAHHAPVRAPRPPATTSGTTPAQALANALGIVQAHGGHVVATGGYGYGPGGAHTALNGGVWVDLGHGQCVGYETYGDPGYFGNAYGFTGGDCS